MPITGLGQSPIAGQAQAPEEAWSWPRIAPRGEGGIEASGLERSCMSARLAAGRRCARNRSGLELGPYGLLGSVETAPLRLDQFVIESMHCDRYLPFLVRHHARVILRGFAGMVTT